MKNSRGFFGIGIYCPKKETNIGTLLRSAQNFQANFTFIIGARYRKQHSDTQHSWLHVPLYEYDDFNHFTSNIPKDTSLVAVELDTRSTPLNSFWHPTRSIYILGAEDNGLPEKILTHCKNIVQLPGKFCHNVAVAGAIIMYDRYTKQQ